MSVSVAGDRPAENSFSHFAHPGAAFSQVPRSSDFVAVSAFSETCLPGFIATSQVDIVVSAASRWFDARHQNGLAGHFKLATLFIWPERFDQFFHNSLTHFRFLKLDN